MRRSRVVPRPYLSLDCAPIAQPTIGTIDQIARLQLTCRRHGCELELKNARPCLLELLDLTGLDEVLRVEAGRQAEEREEPCRVEEESELGDPAV
jgi:hypothetical protein